MRLRAQVGGVELVKAGFIIALLCGNASGGKLRADGAGGPGVHHIRIGGDFVAAIACGQINQRIDGELIGSRVNWSAHFIRAVGIPHGERHAEITLAANAPILI